MLIIGPSSNGGTRMAFDKIWLWWRTTPQPDLSKDPLRAPLELPSPVLPMPNSPWQLPIFTPVPTPMPVPFPLIPKWPPATPDPERGNDPPEPQPNPWSPPVRPSGRPWRGSPGSRPGTRPGQRPGTRPGGRPKPYQEPVDQIEITPGPKPVKPPVPEFHNKVPPGKGEKEKKKIFNPSKDSLLFKFANGATESADFIDAFYDALDWKLRRFKGRDGVWRDKDITPQDKLKRLYKHWDKFGLDEYSKAMDNLRENAAEDAVFGKYGKMLNENVPKHRGVGYGTGGWDNPASVNL